ncbi:hypothetical protein AAVH_05200 [Aphelenchoides avenae]|nr:hypothetical protein AAVH_05200 [Aphelenchus avenae]
MLSAETCTHAALLFQLTQLTILLSAFIICAGKKKTNNEPPKTVQKNIISEAEQFKNKPPNAPSEVDVEPGGPPGDLPENGNGNDTAKKNDPPTEMVSMNVDVAKKQQDELNEKLNDAGKQAGQERKSQKSEAKEKSQGADKPKSKSLQLDVTQRSAVQPLKKKKEVAPRGATRDEGSEPVDEQMTKIEPTQASE